MSQNRRRFLAALGVMGLPMFSGKTFAAPTTYCDETAYRELPGFDQVIRSHVRLVMKPTWFYPEASHPAGMALFSYDAELVDMKTGKKYNTQIPMMAKITPFSAGWSRYSRIVLPPAVEKAINWDKHVLALFYDKPATNRDGQIMYSGKWRFFDYNTDLYTTEGDGIRRSDHLLECVSKMIEKGGSCMLHEYKHDSYRNADVLIREYRLSLKATPVKLKQDFEHAQNALTANWRNWHNAMGKYQCKNRGLSKAIECYLTTAAVETVGLADDCWELQTLRKFRDRVLLLSDEGQRLVKTYYRLAPHLVERINHLPDAQNIWLKTYLFGIVPAAICARLGLNTVATSIYKRMTIGLLKRRK